LKVDDNGDLIKNSCYSGTVGLLLFVGLMVNGPYALITTAVSADLGVHPSLQGSSKALATVTAIIDGTGITLFFEYLISFFIKKVLKTRQNANFFFITI